MAEETQSRLKCFLKASSQIEASIMTAEHLSKLGEGSKVNSALFVLRSKALRNILDWKKKTCRETDSNIRMSDVP